MLNSLFCSLDQLIIARSATPQNDEAIIDGFTCSRVESFVYENSHFGLEKSPD